MSPPWRRGPQVQAPWHHGGHGAVDVVGPVALPGRASSRGDAGVYTDRRKWPLGAVLGHLCTLLRRCGQARGRRSVHRSAKMASRSHFGAFVYTVATRFAEASTHTDPRRASKNLAKLEMILEALQRREGLPEAARDHSLGGAYRGHRECHIEPDWLLIYRIDEEGLILIATRTGSHSELLGP